MPPPPAPFNSNSYKQFYTFYDITLSFSLPYHPQSNSQAERSVQICKKALKKSVIPSRASCDQWPVLISKFLFAYLNTPSTVNGKTSNQLLFNYTRTLMSNFHPKVQFHVTTTSPFKDGESVNLKIGNAPILKGIVARAGSPTCYGCFSFTESTVNHGRPWCFSFASGGKW